MKFEDAVCAIGTLTDLRRVASAHVVDHRNLINEQEIKEALIKVKPQYLHSETVLGSIESAFYKNDNNNYRILSQIIIRDIILNEDGYILNANEAEEKVMAVEQNIVNRSNEIDISDLVSRTNEKKCKDLELYYFVLEVAWENENTKSIDEVNLLRKLSDRLNINARDHFILEAKLGKFPKANNNLHTRDEIRDARRYLHSLGLLFPVRDQEGIDFDVIPKELAFVINEILKREIKEPNYFILVRHKFVYKKSYLCSILEKTNTSFNNSDTLEVLSEKVVQNIPPSILIGGISKNDGISSEDLYKWCSELNLPVSGTKQERIERIISYYDSLRQTDPKPEDERSVWYEMIEALAIRDYTLLRSHNIITKMEFSMSYKVLLVYCNTMMDNLIPVGTSSIIASLRKSGIQVDLFDTTFYKVKEFSGDQMRVRNFQIPSFNYSDFGVSYKKEDIYTDFRSKLSEFAPNLVAFSVVEPTYDLALSLAVYVKQQGISTVFGGVEAIFDYENMINNDLIDMVCIGEGEIAFPELCRRLSQKEDYWNTHNFFIKKDSKVYRNPLTLIKDLNELAPLDVSLYEKERFYRPMAGKIYRMMPVEFSRGCPFSCSYCADALLAERFSGEGKWLRFKSIDSVIDEMKYYISEFKVNYFYFVSETFLAISNKRFDEFIDKYSSIKVPFWFNTRPETITSERIEKLKKIGFHRASIGIEHGNELFRKKMLNRNVSNATILRAIAIMNDMDVSYSVNNIIGFPDETRELVFDTIEINRPVKSNSIGCYIFSPYRGTKLRQYCVERKYIEPDVMVPDLNFESALSMPSMSKKEIAGLARTFSMYVKFPKERWPEIRRAENDTPEGQGVFKRVGKEFIDNFLSMN